MTIKRIFIVEGNGPDKVHLKTDLPACVYPFNESACFLLDVAKGSGKEYCEKNFPDVDIEVVKTR